MERAVTTDELISIEAVKMNLGWMRVAETNSFVGLCNLLQIDPKNDAELNLINRYLVGEVSVMDMLGELKVEITDGKEDQREQEGQSGGEGTEGRTESDPWNEDEEN